MIRSNQAFVWTALATASLALSVGCASTPNSDRMSLSWPWKDKEQVYPTPVKMAVTWTPDILVQPGRTPTRGFGGRIYFYNEKSQAVPVKGELMVHAFEDGVLAESGDASGIKRYRFTEEQFTRHFGETDLGASYSVWIPYDAAGSEQKSLTMVPSFKTTDGKIVQGEGATLLLPGKKVPRLPNMDNSPVIRQVGHYVGKPGMHQGLSGSSNMQTTTIPLPSSFQQRLSRMPEQRKRSARPRMLPPAPKSAPTASAQPTSAP